MVVLGESNFHKAWIKSFWQGAGGQPAQGPYVCQPCAKQTCTVPESNDARGLRADGSILIDLMHFKNSPTTFPVVPI